MKSIIYSCVFGLLAAMQIAGHSHVANPRSITGDVDARVNQNGLDNCGVAAKDSFKTYLAGMNRATRFFPGQTFDVTYHVTNADGAGPIRVEIDETGNGDAFTKTAQVITNVPGTAGRLDVSPTGSFPFNSTLVMTMPNDLNCGGINNQCLVRFIQDSSFGTCAFFNQIQPSPQINQRGQQLFDPRFNSQFNNQFDPRFNSQFINQFDPRFNSISGQLFSNNQFDPRINRRFNNQFNQQNLNQQQFNQQRFNPQQFNQQQFNQQRFNQQRFNQQRFNQQPVIQQQNQLHSQQARV